MNNNSLSGSIPSSLGKLKRLLHLLLDNNNLSGPLPSELSSISTLRIIQLDNNWFGASVPSMLYNMPNLVKLSLRNCSLSGSLRSLTSLTSLKYLDLSQNKLYGELPSDSLPENLTTLILSYNRINGTLTNNLNKLSNLQYLELRNNSLQGTVPYDLGAGVKYTSHSSKLILDLRNNNFELDNYTGHTSNVIIWLNGNKACSFHVSEEACNPSNLQKEVKDLHFEVSSIPLPPGCSSDTCDPSLNQELAYGVLTEHGECLCENPLFVGYRLKSPEFIYFPPYEDAFIQYFSDTLEISQYQVNISSVEMEPGPRLRMNIKLFPQYPSHQFNDSEVRRLYSVLSHWSFSDSIVFGPTELLYFSILYPYNGSVLLGMDNDELSKGGFAGIIIACISVTAALVAGAMFLYSIRYRSATYKKLGKLGRRGHIKIAGVKNFTFKELASATKDFHESMQVGQGGYGKVYKGILTDGSVVAIKRAKEGSLQGENEFYTEIELLSRVHHRNLVLLIGYCDDEGEQMLVYEFMVNGSLRDHLSSRHKRPLDFRTRIQIALGAARGILYLHTEANPPIFHRDIKASNILLDERNNTKVADFGLSKLAPISDVEGLPPSHVSTVVKGTPGYLDPEYFLTKKLTDKSDVYSFGVVLMELVTGMRPIFHGKNLVREVTMAYESGMMLTLVDADMGPYSSDCLEPLVRLAISCCRDRTSLRPSMAEVVRTLDDILHAIPSPDEASTLVSMELSDSSRTEDFKSYLMSSSRSASVDGSDFLRATMLPVAPR